MILQAVLACHSVRGPVNVEPVPNLDELGWVGQLRERRPALFAQSGTSIKDPGWQAVVIQPQYREELLASDDATWENIVRRDYSPALRARDDAWRTALEAYVRGFDPHGRVKAWSNEAQAGFVVSRAPHLDERGLDYKIFFDFHDFTKSIAPDVLARFLVLLDERGFEGDFKTDLRAGVTRYDYNQIIFHAPSIGMALCAEYTGVEFFGSALTYVARGLDVVRDGRIYDWHHFLLEHDLDSLPDEPRAFVEYRIPRAVEDCPSQRAP